MATTAFSTENKPTGCRIRVRGIVQGVGFRPAVWRLARQYQLAGYVLNDGEGVLIELWGSQDALEQFNKALLVDCPPLARIDHLQQEHLSGTPATDFQIICSQTTAMQTGVVADAATCPACIEDIFDPENRRYRYPLTNCTNCGPRLSIIDEIPYDRANTSMAEFIQCPNCQQEYENPESRRFHAQPNACPECGPQVWLEPESNNISGTDELERAQYLLKQGYIIAIKGVGGFHIACDAYNEQSVSRLRQRKHRYAKPFALMARNIDIINSHCKLNHAEINLLYSSAAPIVLLERKAASQLAAEVAPGQKTLGFMLPYTPLHHLLLHDYDHPIVLTSGNVSDSPQCINNDAARTNLKGVADFWLLHDRDVFHRIDDSVVRVIKNKKQTLRRARGYAPSSIPLPEGFDQQQELLAFGAELKNTFCLIKDGHAIVSQHMGDLENAETLMDYEKNLALYQRLYNHQPTVLAVDAHPGYVSSQLGRGKAETEKLALIEVSHHHAHIASCLAENGWPAEGEKVLGIVLDGLGFGQDGSLWGGEFILADYSTSERLGGLKAVALIGATQAMYEPWRNTYAHLIVAIGWENIIANYQSLDLVSFLQRKPLDTFNAMLSNGVNSPLASSCGRLFDAVAAAIGICREHVSYEGQAAIELEALVNRTLLHLEKNYAYPFQLIKASKTQHAVLEPRPMWQALLTDLIEQKKPEVIAARFHLGLAKGIIEMVEHLADREPDQRTQTIVLSGGVFQNQILFEHVKQELEDKKYQVLCHSEVPANDGGLALGQAVVALAQTMKEESICA